MGELNNQWGELDEHPVVGRFHVRHAIPAAAQTGCLFGKNFDTLFDAIEFAQKQIFSPKVLVYAGDDRWLKFEPPFAFDYYYVPGSEDDAPTHKLFMGPLAEWAHGLNGKPVSTEKLAKLVQICSALVPQQPTGTRPTGSTSAPHPVGTNR